MLIGIDSSVEMINTANNNRRNHTNKRVKFFKMSGSDLEFPNEFFDVILARHSIINAREINKCLKTGGYFFSEDIDEDDCKELKQIFGRGQGFSVKEKLITRYKNNLSKYGFDFDIYPIVQDEYYKTEDDILFLLSNTPIIPNFGKKTDDYIKLKKYINDNTTEKGIHLKRRLFGIKAIKKIRR